jgi:hypothetical protein
LAASSAAAAACAAMRSARPSQPQGRNTAHSHSLECWLVVGGRFRSGYLYMSSLSAFKFY